MGGGEAGEVVKRGGEVVRGNQYLSITLITNYSNYQLINRLFITRRQVVQVVSDYMRVLRNVFRRYSTIYRPSRETQRGANDIFFE